MTTKQDKAAPAATVDLEAVVADPVAAPEPAPATLAAPAPAPTVLTFGRLPYNIELFGNVSTVYAQAAALIRVGYVFNQATPAPALTYPGGTAMLFLVLGSPDAAAVEDAKAAVDAARAAEEADFENRVQAAAKQIVEAENKAARQAENDAKIAAAEAALAQLRENAEASLAALKASAA